MAGSKRTFVADKQTHPASGSTGLLFVPDASGFRFSIMIQRRPPDIKRERKKKRKRQTDIKRKS